MRLTIAAGTRVVAVENGARVEPKGPPDVELPDGWAITPALVDLQVNGMEDAFPVEDPSRLTDLDGMLARHGVARYLVAVPSSDPAQVRALALAARDMSSGFLGLHLEGPVLAPSFRGAHPAEHLRTGDDPAALALLDLPNVRLVTVAPEVHGAMEYARDAMARGIVVAAGHSGATAEQARAAIDAGITLCTHLFNAMTPVHQRAPGIAIAYLVDERARVAFIADGEHLHDDIVELILRAARDRCVLVSDAAPAGGVYADRHGGEVLAGSTTSIADAVRRLVARHGMTLDDAVHLASARPAGIIGDHDVERADLVLWDPDLRVAGCMRDGVFVFRSPELDALL